MVKLRLKSSIPPITIILPIYNSAKYLEESVASIKKQTFQKFVVLCMNDGSTDNSLKVLKHLTRDDKRFLIVNHVHNQGLVNTLNEGIKRTESPFIARMDPDDIMEPTRLEKQYQMLISNPTVDIVGTWIHNFGKYNYTWKTHSTHDYITTKMLFETSIAHPSIMMRRKVLQTVGWKYPDNIVGAEDFMMWSLLAEKGARFTNIPQVLLQYRTHTSQIGEKLKTGQQEGSWIVRKYNLRRLGINPTEEEKRLHQKISSWIPFACYDEAQKGGMWLSKILEANMNTSIYSQSVLRTIIGEKWLVMCYISGNSIISRCRLLFSNPRLLPLAVKTFYVRSLGKLYAEK